MTFKPVDPNPDFPKLEEELLSYWEKNKIFEKSLEQTRPKNVIPAKAGIQGQDPRVKPGDEKQKLFTFYDGPPFATGLPHYGHILASTIKDLVPRYQTMKGRFVRRRWGWDCHGLPIEELVERELGISGKKDIEEKVGIEKFNATCRKYVLKYAEEWGKMVRRIARWIEFENSYKTMDLSYMESVWWAFKQIYDKGLVYQGRKVLLYCPRCETPVSNFEVAMDNSYQMVTDNAVTVKFRLKDNSWPIKEKPTYLLSWTTTPWTLIGNVALAVGDNIEYVPVDVGEEVWILAKDRLDILEGKDYQTIKGKQVNGNSLKGWKYEPLYEVEEVAKDKKSHAVYIADFVNTDEGTGIVHTAVVYGEDDYELGMREGLPVVPLLDEKGRFNDKAPVFIRGLSFKQSEEKIIADLEKRGLLLHKEKYTHSYPHCWRCENPLFYNAIPAWFINIQKIKADLLKSNDKELNWYPEHLKHGRYENSVKDAPDWNISRNRYWGNPIPVWVCEKCNEKTVVGSISELVEKAANSELLTPNSEVDLHRPYIDEVVLKCDHCGGEAKRITEIFDSWFEAGSMPFAEYHYPFENKEVFEARYPAQFVAEYIAQTRAWFYVMHVIGLVLFGKAPFENVVTTGTILAEDGSKMSKSRRNFPDPWAVIDKYGVDSLRFYLMNSTVMQAENLNFSEKELQVVNRKVFRILWNILNYFVTYANEAKWRPRVEAETKILNKWMNARTQELVNQVTEYLDHYDTVRATRVIENYISDFSTWYVRRSRGTSDSNFFATLYSSLLILAKVIAPVMPYMAEKIYLTLKLEQSEQSIHLHSWPDVVEIHRGDKDLLVQMTEIRNVVEQAHSLRAQAGIKLRQPLANLTIPNTQYPIPDTLLEILKDEVNVKEIAFGDKLELDTTITDELKLEGLAAELQRLINEFRKQSGLKIGQKAELYYETASKEIEKAFQLVEKGKVYASEIRPLDTAPSASSSGPRGRGENRVDFRTEIEVESERVKLFLNLTK